MWEMDLECTDAGGGGVGGVGARIVFIDAFVSVDDRVSRGTGSGSGSGSSTVTLSCSRSRSPYAERSFSILAGGDGGSAPVCVCEVMIRVKNASCTGPFANLTVSSVTFRIWISCSCDARLESVCNGFTGFESRGVGCIDEEAVNGAVWNDAADDETALWLESRWAPIDIGEGDLRTTGVDI